MIASIKVTNNLCQMDFSSAVIFAYAEAGAMGEAEKIAATWGVLIVLGTGRVLAPDRDLRDRSKIGNRLLCI